MQNERSPAENGQGVSPDAHLSKYDTQAAPPPGPPADGGAPSEPSDRSPDSSAAGAVDKYQYIDFLKDNTTYKYSGFDEPETFVYFEHIASKCFTKISVGTKITPRALSRRFGDKRKVLTKEELPVLHDLPERENTSSTSFSTTSTSTSQVANSFSTTSTSTSQVQVRDAGGGGAGGLSGGGAGGLSGVAMAVDGAEGGAEGGAVEAVQDSSVSANARGKRPAAPENAIVPTGKRQCTQLAVCNDEPLVLPLNSSIGQEQADRLALAGVNNDAIVAIACFPEGEAAGMVAQLCARHMRASHRKDLSKRYYTSYIKLQAKQYLGTAAAVQDHFQKREIAEAIRRAEEQAQEEEDARAEAEEDQLRCQVQKKDAVFLMTAPPHEWTMERFQSLLSRSNDPNVRLPELRRVTKGAWVRRADTPVFWECVFVHTSQQCEMHIWVSVTAFFGAWPDAHKRAENDYRKGAIERIEVKPSDGNAPWLQKKPTPKMPCRLFKNPSEGPNRLELVIDACNKTMQEYSKAIASDDPGAYMRARDKSQLYMLSNTGSIPLEVLNTVLDNFGEGLYIGTDAAILRSYGIEVWFCPVTKKQMVTGFQSALALESGGGQASTLKLDACLGLPTGFSRKGNAANFECFLAACERSVQAETEYDEANELRKANRKSEYASALVVSQYLQLSKTGSIPLTDLQQSFDQYCRASTEITSTGFALTPDFLKQYSMTVVEHQGGLVVTGLEEVKIVEV